MGSPKKGDTFSPTTIGSACNYDYITENRENKALWELENDNNNSDLEQDI